MPKEVEMGSAGSLTVALLCISVALLLRSFYKRYTKLSERNNESDEN